MIIIDVPDVPAPPGICWKESPGMERCMFRKGHRGPHQWARTTPTGDQRTTIGAKDTADAGSLSGSTLPTGRE